MYKDDEKWVTEQINKLPTIELKLLAWSCYKRKYDTEFNNQPIDYKKINTARHSANKALREYVHKTITGQSS